MAPPNDGWQGRWHRASRGVKGQGLPRLSVGEKVQPPQPKGDIPQVSLNLCTLMHWIPGQGGLKREKPKGCLLDAHPLLPPTRCKPQQTSAGHERTCMCRGCPAWGCLGSKGLKQALVWGRMNYSSVDGNTTQLRMGVICQTQNQNN